ncbi:hypothetical protein ACJ41O_014576 [Fusarium nematophilum]
MSSISSMSASSAIDPDAFPVPTYTATDDGNLLTRIENASAVEFPILHSPASRTTDVHRLVWGDDAYRLETDIVDSFFTSIETGHDDLVQEFVSRGWVSPDTTSRYGETPLLAAVRAGRTPMVSRLVALGAMVNAFGQPFYGKGIFLGPNDGPERTPLMVAAERGHLALVRVLMEDYGADDSIVAPDGAIALRLAAGNRHREIVQYLPARRAGAWLRWKTAHKKQMERARRAWDKLVEFITFFVWKVPKFFAYDVPKEIGQGLWKRRHRMANACKRMIRELPGTIKRGVVALPGKMKRGGKKVWGWMKEIPPILKMLAVELWKMIKRIPGAVMIVLRWIGRCFAGIGKALADVVLRLVSLLHTAVMAVVTFFQSITLKDVWDGFCYLARAIFVDAPKAIGAFIVSFGKLTYDFLKAVFGSLGSCIWYIGVGILWLIQYIPQKIWTIIEAMGTSVVKAYQETMAYLNPKRM